MGTNLDQWPPEIRALLDKQEITELVYRYCRAVDRIDPELGYTIWHDGAKADYGSIYKGTGRGFIDFVCEGHRQGLVHSHQITNILIELSDGHAHSESYVTSVMRMMKDDVLMQIATRGRYLDRWAKRGGRWGIEQRHYVHDLDEARPVTPGYVPPTFRLDRTDPSYGFFAGAA